MERRYRTVDVFTERMFGGNPLAVVLDAQELSAAQMQSIAAEFNYAESTFVLPARDPAHTAQVRIFTPRSEVPFAGHPNVGTAFVLAQLLAAEGKAVPERFEFEEGAGIVPVRILREGNAISGAELTAPEPLSRGATIAPSIAAACLMLPDSDIATAVHAPMVASVGLPFLIAELCSREALSQSRPDLTAHEQFLPGIGVDAIFAYVREKDEGESGVLHARMYAPLDGIPRIRPPGVRPPRPSRSSRTWSGFPIANGAGECTRAMTWEGRACFWVSRPSAPVRSAPCAWADPARRS